jgi:lactoylglutathione lyase
MPMNQGTGRGTAIQVAGVVTVGIPVDEQDRAVDFYVGVCRAGKRLDVSTPGGGRWITVGPPGSTGTTLALIVAPRLRPARGGDGRAALHSRRRLRPRTAPWPRCRSGRGPALARGARHVRIRDQDGNGLELIESSAPST